MRDTLCKSIRIVSFSAQRSEAATVPEKGSSTARATLRYVNVFFTFLVLSSNSDVQVTASLACKCRRETLLG